MSQRDTHVRPTRSAVIGLLAAALGRRRGADLSDLRGLRFTVRTDRSGTRQVDFQTIGGGLPPVKAVPSANGDRKKDGTATIVTRRHYLADAAFTVAVDGDKEVVDAATRALRAPRWPLYLGRRSCPPAGPVLVAHGLDDAAGALATFPLHRARPYGTDTVKVDIAYDRPPAKGHPARHRVMDDPETFDEYRRSWGVRTEYVSTLTLSTELCAGLGTDWINALANRQQAST
ncbi:type I-E CRISPR-associated protein Cas5/CasD [Streptomyces sp. NPDC051000]|uniref:type I-E CRISPR-associated protein Cas5/CasD n=1 Tax=Streptomyces sp. NPDC051000 TaxID=3155520 RepID=UPI0034062517